MPLATSLKLLAPVFSNVSLLNSHQISTSYSEVRPDPNVNVTYPTSTQYNVSCHNPKFNVSSENQRLAHSFVDRPCPAPYVSHVNNVYVPNCNSQSASVSSATATHVHSISHVQPVSESSCYYQKMSQPNVSQPTHVNKTVTCNGGLDIDQQHSVMSNHVLHSFPGSAPAVANAPSSTNFLHHVNVSQRSNPFLNVHAKHFTPQVTHCNPEQKMFMPNVHHAPMVGSTNVPLVGSHFNPAHPNVSISSNCGFKQPAFMHPSCTPNVPTNNVMSPNVCVDSQQSLVTKHLLTQSISKNPIDQFDGTAHRFWGWIDQIKTQIVGLSLSPSEILNIIESNCTDAPKNMITSFKAALGVIDEVSFQKIWDTLVERFGSTQETARQLMEKLKKFPQVKGTNTGRLLRDLHDLCIIIEFNKARCPELAILDLSSGCRHVVEKLPGFLIDKWCTHGQNYEDLNGGRHPPFSVFIEFLRQHSRRLNNTHYDFSVTTEKKEVKVMVTSTVSKPSENCPIHETASHNLTDCYVFRKMSTSEKQDKLKELRLCFLCFGSHLRTDCKEDIKCNKCSKTHNTLLHRDTPSQPRPASNPSCPHGGATCNTEGSHFDR